METKQSPKSPKFIDAFGQDAEMDVEGTMATDWLKLHCSAVVCSAPVPLTPVV